jgi:hypothetical protein
MADTGFVWIEDVELEDANIKWGWSNWDGRADGGFNNEGDHNFTVSLPPELGEKLKSEGWNVKTYEAREEGDPPEYTLEIKISYKFNPPKIYFIKNDRKVRIWDERDLADVTRAATKQVNVVFTPSRWERNGRSGITAYVRELYVEIRESRFADKYKDFEEA